MKYIFFLLALSFSGLLQAQDSTEVKAESPKIVSKLDFGRETVFGDISLKFVELLSDSRCPQNVTCVWAGEVKVLIDIFKNGKKIEQKTLVFGATSKFQEELAAIYKVEGLTIFGYDIVPYPVYGEKIALEDYCIQLELKH